MTRCTHGHQTPLSFLIEGCGVQGYIAQGITGTLYLWGQQTQKIEINT